MLLRTPGGYAAEEVGAEGSGQGSGGAPESGVSADPSPLHWAAALPEDLQGLPIVKDARSLTDFVKNAHHTKSFVGKSLQVPDGYDPVTGPADGVDVSGVFKKLGMPDTPADYTIEYKAVPDGLQVTVNPDEQRAFREVAHKAGLSQWQVQRLVDFDTQRQVNAANRAAGEAATAVQQGLAKLHELHGANTPTVQEHARFVYELMQAGVFGTPELSERIMTKMHEKGLATDPDWVTGLAALGMQMRGSRFLGAEQPLAGAEGLPEIQTKIEALTTKAYSPGGVTRSEEAELDRLYELKARYLAA